MKNRVKRMKRNAAKAPAWLRTGAAATFDPRGERQHRSAKLGTFGAASDVRHIDVTEYLRTPSPSQEKVAS